jgi:hypothetical protein
VSSSDGFGHLRASRRPAWWPWRSSPGGHSRGSPTRHCAHRNSRRRWHNAVYGTPAVARRLVLSCVSTTRTERAPKPQPSWWRGLPARAKTTCLRSSGPTTGKMPVAPWAGPTGAVRVVSPVAFRAPASRFFFSDDWLRHARFGESATATAAAAGTGSGTAAASSVGARYGHRNPATATATVTDQAVAKHRWLPQPTHRPRHQPMPPTTNRCAQIPNRARIEPWPNGSWCTSHAVSSG